MFTGIIEGLMKVTDVMPKKDFSVVSIDLKGLSKGKKAGDSISVNGACLTITLLDGQIASFDIMKETLDKTNLGALMKGSLVNIERPLRIGGSLDGHFVLGHVDGVGTIKEILKDRDNCVIWIDAPEQLAYGLIPKGSIGVDGISLTIADIRKNRFAIALIPHTLGITTLGIKKEGDNVNLEIDYIGKWILKTCSKG